MRKTILICITLVLLTSGCANRRPVSAGDVFAGIGEAILSQFSESETDRWRRVNTETYNRRQQSKADNGS